MDLVDVKAIALSLEWPAGFVVHVEPVDRSGKRYVAYTVRGLIGGDTVPFVVMALDNLFDVTEARTRERLAAMFGLVERELERRGAVVCQ